MRRISAHYVFPVKEKPIRNGVVILDDQGYILGLENPGNSFSEKAQTEFYNGILVPGFVNAHCHLELSHVKASDEYQGLADFVRHIQKNRYASQEIIEKEIRAADERMWVNGISAVGDICNTDFTFSLKAKSNIRYYSFIEVFGLDGSKAPYIYKKAEDLALQYKKMVSQYVSVVPHAAYSVSRQLFELINNGTEKDALLSVHNCESLAEQDLFASKTGQLAALFYSLGFDLSDIPESVDGSSFLSMAKLLPKDKKILFVHNTYMTEKLQEIAAGFFPDAFMSLCPSSNILIENKLPDIEGLYKRWPDRLCIGTDSIASNNQLSILNEMLTIMNYFPSLSFDDVLKWGTINGAKVLGFDEELGSFEVGKKPGVILINSIDYATMKPGVRSGVRRLV